MSYVNNKHMKKFEEYDSTGKVISFIIWLKDIIPLDAAIHKFGQPSTPCCNYMGKRNGEEIFRYRWDTVDELGRKSIIYVDTTKTLIN